MKRTRSSDEAVLASIEISNQVSNDHGKLNAIDLDLDTSTVTGTNDDGENWLKITLDQVHCVEHVIEYNQDGTNQFKWTCSQDNCDQCSYGTQEQYCNKFSLTVNIESEDPSYDFPSQTNCRNGNTVKLERLDFAERDTFTVAEIAVFGQIGKTDVCV